MAQHIPWQFFILKFTAGDKKHTVSVGAADRQNAIDLIMDMYGNVGALQVIPRDQE